VIQRLRTAVITFRTNGDGRQAPRAHGGAAVGDLRAVILHHLYGQRHRCVASHPHPSARANAKVCTTVKRTFFLSFPTGGRVVRWRQFLRHAPSAPAYSNIMCVMKLCWMRTPPCCRGIPPPVTLHFVAQCRCNDRRGREWHGQPRPRVHELRERRRGPYVACLPPPAADTCSSAMIGFTLRDASARLPCISLPNRRQIQGCVMKTPDTTHVLSRCPAHRSFPQCTGGPHCGVA